MTLAVVWAALFLAFPAKHQAFYLDPGHCLEAAPCFLLQRDDIRRELALTLKQRSGIDSKFKRAKPWLERNLRSGMDSSGVCGLAPGYIGMVSADNWELLSEPQKARLLQIQAQVLGAFVLTEEAVCLDLHLSESQLGKMQAILAKASAHLGFRTGTPIPDRGPSFKKEIADTSRREEKDLLELLTSVQRWRLLSVFGPPFEGARPNSYWPI